METGDVLVCYGGTQLQDGLWKHLKNHVPQQLSTNGDEKRARIAKYLAYWAWRYRRASVADMFHELGNAVAAVTG